MPGSRIAAAMSPVSPTAPPAVGLYGGGSGGYGTAVGESAPVTAAGGVHGFPAALTSFIGRAGPLRCLGQPERVIDRGAGDAVRIVVHLARMQRHPQPHPFRRAAARVVPGDRCGKHPRKTSDQPGLRDLGRDQDERAVAPVLTDAASPADPALRESTSQRLIQRLADRELVQVGPGGVTEPFHIHHHDRAVNS